MLLSNASQTNYNVYDVATPEAWKKNPEMVQDFYNMRRKSVLEAQPNAAHQILANLEKDFNVTIITQNVDDLHEKAGSTNVIHLHGELTKVRSTLDSKLVYGVVVDKVRLYYRSVQFSSEVAEKYAKMLQSGFTKQISYDQCDVYNYATNRASGTSSYTELITPSVIAPTRIWRLCVPTGFDSSQTIPFVSIQPINNANILINNQPYYQSDLQTDMQFFDILRQQTPAVSKDCTTMAGLISTQDFRNNYRLF
jgi:hypothetical protein